MHTKFEANLDFMRHCFNLCACILMYIIIFHKIGQGLEHLTTLEHMCCPEAFFYNDCALILETGIEETTLVSATIEKDLLTTICMPPMSMSSWNSSPFWGTHFPGSVRGEPPSSLAFLRLYLGLSNS